MDLVSITTLAPADSATVQAVFDALSARSRYQRYHTGLPRLSPRMLRELADVRPGRHQAYVARRGTTPVGLARWIRDASEPTVAEVALEVVDAAHRQGIGTRLLRAAADGAFAHGVRHFVAHVSPGNRAVRRWVARLGATSTARDGLVLPVARLRDPPA